MMMWLTALPFTLVASLGWGAVPACGVIAYLLLGNARVNSWSVAWLWGDDG